MTFLTVRHEFLHPVSSSAIGCRKPHVNVGVLMQEGRGNSEKIVGTHARETRRCRHSHVANRCVKEPQPKRRQILAPASHIHTYTHTGYRPTNCGKRNRLQGITIRLRVIRSKESRREHPHASGRAPTLFSALIEKKSISRFGGVLAAGRAAVVVLRLALPVGVGEPARRTGAAGPAPPGDLFVAVPVCKRKSSTYLALRSAELVRLIAAEGEKGGGGDSHALFPFFFLFVGVSFWSG